MKELRARGGTVRRLAAAGAVLLALLALVIGRGGSVAADEGDAPHPAHIHAGTCDKLNPNPAYPLGNVAADFTVEGTPVAGTPAGGEESLTVEGSVTTVNVSLDDLLAKPYAINVHKSAAEIQTYIACGNIAGHRMGNTLVIGLAEQNNSGESGVAVLEGNGGQTKVSLYLTSAYHEEGTPAAGGSGSTAGTAAVTIMGFAFSPARLEISAGTTVAWTNMDNVPHTVTADDRSFDSGRLDNGATFRHTFDKPGTYTYHCQFHSASMKATIVVK